MDLFESSIHSFVIKIWLEETLHESDHQIWRGYVTHVNGGEREAFSELEQVLDFIKPYLALSI